MGAGDAGFERELFNGLGFEIDVVVLGLGLTAFVEAGSFRSSCLIGLVADCLVARAFAGTVIGVDLVDWGAIFIGIRIFEEV